MPKQSPRDLCVVLSNRLVRLFPLLIERSIMEPSGRWRKRERRLFASSSNLEEIIVRTSLIRPSNSMDEGHSLCLASICTILVAASPNPSKPVFRFTASRKIRLQCDFEVVRTFRLACHKACPCCNSEIRKTKTRTERSHHNRWILARKVLFCGYTILD